MAITLDHALGSANFAVVAAGAQTALVTTSAATAGSRIVVCISWFDINNAAVTLSDGTAYTKDKQVDNGGDHYAVFSRVAAAGLASSSSITATVAAGTGGGGMFLMACSYLGTTGVDTSGQATGTTSASWSSGSALNTVADALYVGGSGADGTIASESSTATNGTERFDLFLGSQNQAAVMQDLIVSSIASQALTGTWANTTGLTSSTGALVIYKGTAAATTAAVLPVFLPRRLGPKAVGPTFFSPPNPPPMFGTPAQPGFLAGPVYLPRRLGPMAVGPPFFAAIQQRQPLSPQQAPAPIWLPPTTFPSTRNRTFFVVRGHRVVPVPIADPPIPFVRPRSPRRETARLMRGQRPFPVQPQIPVPPTVPGNRTSSLARRLFALMPRGNGRLPVQPQIAVPPTVPGNRAPAGRRWAFPVRGRRWLPTPPQDPVWPTRIESIRSRLTMLRRGRQVSTVPAQVTVPPTIPGNRWSSARSRFLMLRRGSRPFTPQPTTPPVLAWPPPKLGATRRLLSAPTRPRRTPVPADQHAPLRAAHPRYGLTPRRGHHVTVTPPQIAVPPTRVPRIATRWRWAAVRRGHQTNPVLTQIVVFLTPPCITPPTTAAIMAYISRAAVSAYTATAKIMAYFSVSSINAYESDGEPFSYAASPAIVSYSSKAAIVIYTSTSRIGPRFCP